MLAVSGQVIRFEDTHNQTTEEYFRGNQFSIDAFNKKYTAFDGETYVQAIKRVCDYIALAEDRPDLREYWSRRWFDEIYNDWWHPAGSIIQGAASGRKISLCNCTTISLGTEAEGEEWDNLESIIKNTAYTVAKSAAYRQGLGVDFSRIRPRNATVLNSSRKSSGAVHWMKFIDSIGYYVGQKGRIPAMLFSLSCSHPDVEEFIKVKGDKTQIQNANISVQCTDNFYQAIENDSDWELCFSIPETTAGQKVFIDAHSTTIESLKGLNGKWYYIAKQSKPAEIIKKTVKARQLMELIAKCMVVNAEPGIQNIDVARKYSNSDYVYDSKSDYDSRIVSSNACSEQYLSRESLCVLSSANAGRFSPDLSKFEVEIEKIGYSMNRFLDNVNEMELRVGTYATPHQRLAIESLRRTGAGITNIGGWLFKNGFQYGTEDGNCAVEHFIQRLNYYLYKSSIEIGKEKGSFGLFNRKKFEQSPFVQRMMSLGLEFETMRNVTTTSIAPTGSLSLLFRDLIASYGIEPAFGLYFWKRTRISGKYEYYFCVPSIVRELFKERGLELPMEQDAIKDTWSGKLGSKIATIIEENKDRLGIYFRSSADIKPMEKLDLMARAMKWCDSSISVTYLLPEGSDWKDVYDFILEAHKKEIKSIAAFPDRKMYGIVSSVPFKQLAIELTNSKVDIHRQNFTDEEFAELRSLSSKIVPVKITKTTAPSRPKTLECDVHQIKITKKLDKIRTLDYLVFVGLLNDEPYEVFAMENNGLDKKYSKGLLTKVKNGVYCATFPDGTKIEDITKDTTEEEDIFTRMTSTSLRHGADIKFVVEQLEKAEGGMGSFGKAMARALKKYIPNGEPIKGECPQCGGNLVRQEGCKACTLCDYSACN